MQNKDNKSVVDTLTDWNSCTSARDRFVFLEKQGTSLQGASEQEIASKVPPDLLEEIRGILVHGEYAEEYAALHLLCILAKTHQDSQTLVPLHTQMSKQSFIETIAHILEVSPNLHIVALAFDLFTTLYLRKDISPTPLLIILSTANELVWETVHKIVSTEEFLTVTEDMTMLLSKKQTSISDIIQRKEFFPDFQTFLAGIIFNLPKDSITATNYETYRPIRKVVFEFLFTTFSQYKTVTKNALWRNDWIPPITGSLDHTEELTKNVGSPYVLINMIIDAALGIVDYATNRYRQTSSSDSPQYLKQQSSSELQNQEHSQSSSKVSSSSSTNPLGSSTSKSELGEDSSLLPPLSPRTPSTPPAHSTVRSLSTPRTPSTSSLSSTPRSFSTSRTQSPRIQALHTPSQRTQPPPIQSPPAFLSEDIAEDAIFAFKLLHELYGLNLLQTFHAKLLHTYISDSVPHLFQEIWKDAIKELEEYRFNPEQS